MIKQLSINPLTPIIGAEIRGINLTQLSDEEFAFLRRSWLAHKVIFIRDQRLGPESLSVFNQRFGSLMQLPYIKPMVDHPNVIEVL